MSRWVPRVLGIVAVSGAVSVLLPGIRSALKGGPFGVGAPDAGSLLVAAAVAIALLRLFFTLDRRRGARG